MCSSDLYAAADIQFIFKIQIASQEIVTRADARDAELKRKKCPFGNEIEAFENFDFAFV